VIDVSFVPSGEVLETGHHAFPPPNPNHIAIAARNIEPISFEVEYPL
jgi:hypothetical protein